MEVITVKTTKKNELIDITSKIQDIVVKSKIKEGICNVFTTHATAALIINENADPNICLDTINALDKLIPEGIWKHDRIDGNAAAHIKAAIIGCDKTIPVKDNRLFLGTWQGIMLAEWDGPRERKIVVNIIKV